MFSLQQLIKATTQCGNVGSSGAATASDLYKFLRHVSATTRGVTSSATAIPKQYEQQQQQQQEPNESSQATASSKSNFIGDGSVSHTSSLKAHGCCHGESESASKSSSTQFLIARYKPLQDTQRQFHTQPNRCSKSSQQQTTKFAMSSLAAEPLQALKPDEVAASASDSSSAASSPGASCLDAANASTGKKPCFSTGLAEIVQFMELIGNLKHTKRTGWVLRDVNDCESISGHMYRMSMLTFLLDGSEGLNQIRCMELALVHDLAESLVGDITPFCGISKDDKRSMEFKAMEDICKLIEPRGKRIMELFEEYEHAQSAESKFVKDLDRLDMVMQAFEYEKRDNCLLKHQEFFDSTEGKFNHPFVKKLVNEIYEQRDVLAKAKGATPPPTIEVPRMELTAASTTKLVNGHGSSS